MWDALIAEAALHRATIYGVKDTNTGRYERMCGDPGKAVECGPNAITASGVRFDPDQPHVAVHAPKKYRLRKGMMICLVHKNGIPVWLPLTDKKGFKGLDLSKASVIKLGYHPTKHWSQKLTYCGVKYGKVYRFNRSKIWTIGSN